MTQRNLFKDVKKPTHSRLGRDFESELETVHRRVYAMQKSAFIQKNNLDWLETTWTNLQKKLAEGRISDRQWAKTGDGRFLISAQTKPDFEGGAKIFDARTNTHVLFDAKETANKSFPLKNVKPHQLVSLAEAERCGSVAGLLIHFSAVGRAFFIAASEVEKAQAAADLAKRRSRDGKAERGTQSLSIEDCAAVGTEVFQDRGFWDWLKALESKR